MDKATVHIIEGLRSMVSQSMPDATFAATVQTVDMDKRTCEAVTAEGITIYEVTLQGASGKSTGLVLFPTVGSVVQVSRTEAGVWYVSAFTDVDKLTIKTAEEDMKELLTDLIDAILKMTVTTAVGPSGTPINAEAFTNIKTRVSNLLT